MTACSFTFTGLTHKGLTFNFILLILKYYHVNVEKHKQDSTKTKARETLEVCFAGKLVESEFLFSVLVFQWCINRFIGVIQTFKLVNYSLTSHLPLQGFRVPHTSWKIWGFRSPVFPGGSQVPRPFWSYRVPGSRVPLNGFWVQGPM